MVDEQRRRGTPISTLGADKAYDTADFVADLRDSLPGQPVFNRAVSLRDSWAAER